MPVNRNSISFIVDVVPDVDFELVAWSSLDDGAGKLAWQVSHTSEDEDAWPRAVYYIPFIRYTGFSTPSGSRSSRVIFHVIRNVFGFLVLWSLGFRTKPVSWAGSGRTTGVGVGVGIGVKLSTCVVVGCGLGSCTSLWVAAGCTVVVRLKM